MQPGQHHTQYTFPQHISYGYPANPTFQQPQQYPHYRPLHQSATQLQPQQQSQFFHALPQGSAPGPAPQQQRPQQPRLQQQASSRSLQNGTSSLPSSPGNGPGAPSAQHGSPGSNYEENLMNALQQEKENETRNVEDEDEDNDNENDNDNDDQMDEDNPDEPVYQLPPPPEAIYPNEVELEKAMHAWSLEHGYELVRRASKKNARGQLYKRYFHCSKHGKVSQLKTQGKTKVRVNRKSNRIGCPMSLAAVSVDPHDPSGNWQIRHRKTHHNHPAVDAIKLAGHRRRARMGGVEKAVDGLFAINTSTSDVLKFLQRTNPDGLFSRTDVANMKLKFKKYGTSGQPGNESLIIEKTATPSKSGFPSACMTCRQKKTKCDSVRPVCGTCQKAKVQCHYDHAPHPKVSQPAQNNEPRSSPAAPPKSRQNGVRNGSQTTVQSGISSSMSNSLQHIVDGSTIISLDEPMVEASGPTQPTPPTQPTQPMQPTQPTQPSNHRTAYQQQQTAREAEHYLAIMNFQQQYVKPVKLTLESSTVETLAHSTCGNGDSYKTVTPRPFVLGADWHIFQENFLSAAVKENTHDVLLGEKKEPATLEGEPSVEEHNEYVKQLAIYKRRNEMLKVGLKECLHASLWSRLNSLHDAASMWAALEDICMPRGSEHAYYRFNDFFNITLQNSGTYENYVHNLESRRADFNMMTHHHDTRRPPATVSQSSAEKLKRSNGGNGSIPEELLCLFFLRGLGQQHQALVNNVCIKNNIGGYGSGDRVSFKELTMMVKRGMEWEAQRAGSGVVR